MQWFKNLQVYRLPANYAMTAERLAELLATQAFAPLASNEMIRSGFVAPVDGGDLVHVVQGQFLMKVATEKRLLPSSVVNAVAKAKADELEEQQGFRPGKKAMKDLKERVADELLPRAFAIPSAVLVWMDPRNGWLVIDTPTASKADDVLKMMLKAIDLFPVQSLRVQRSPTACMTGWIEADEAPAGFTVDQDAELRATGESRATIKFVKHSIDVDDARRHIAAGKQVRRLAMTFNDRVSFVLEESLAIKRVAALDVIKEGGPVTYSDLERFENDFYLMTAELNELLRAIVESLGGEAGDFQGDIVNQQNQDPAPTVWPGKAGATKKRKPEQGDLLAAPKAAPAAAEAAKPSPAPRRDPNEPPKPGYRLVYSRKCRACDATGRERDGERCIYCQGSGNREWSDWMAPEAAEAIVTSGKGQILK